MTDNVLQVVLRDEASHSTRPHYLSLNRVGCVTRMNLLQLQLQFGTCLTPTLQNTATFDNLIISCKTLNTTTLLAFGGTSWWCHVDVPVSLVRKGSCKFECYLSRKSPSVSLSRPSRICCGIEITLIEHYLIQIILPFLRESQSVLENIGDFVGRGRFIVHGL